MVSVMTMTMIMNSKYSSVLPSTHGLLFKIHFKTKNKKFTDLLPLLSVSEKFMPLGFLNIEK